MLENGFTGGDSPTLHHDVSRWFLENEIVLLARHTGQLYHLNTTAAVIWCCCEERQSVDQIVATLTATFSTDRQQSREDVNRVLQEWIRHNLLVRDDSGQYHPSQQSIVKTKRPGRSSRKKLAADLPANITRSFTLLDTRFYLYCDSIQAADTIQRGMQHLVDVESADTSIQIDLFLRKKRTGYELYIGDSRLASCDSQAGLFPLVHAQMLLLAYQQSHCLFALHSATVVRGNACLLMPGSPGSGKSTLTAALLTQNWTYYTDEISLLDAGSVKVRPAPACVGIKSGSWQALLPFYPDLMELPEWHRMDGQQIRYLAPPPSSLPGDVYQDRASVTHVVFPVYTSNARLSLRPISYAEALCRIAEAGYDTQTGLTADNVGQLVDWIQGVSCFEMVFSDLSDAIQSLNGLIAYEI